MSYAGSLKFTIKTFYAVLILLTFTQADFHYIIKNPATRDAQKYIIHKSNFSLLSESSGTVFWHPNRGSYQNGNSPGIIIYHFPLAEPIQEASLFVRTDTYHWNYSRGHSLIFLSTNGKNWGRVVNNPAPNFGKWNSGNYSGKLPTKFIGKSDIYLKVILYSYGSKASEGGVMSNTAQHSRYEPSHNNITLKLDAISQTGTSTDFSSVLNNIASDKNLKQLSFQSFIEKQNDVNHQQDKHINHNGEKGDCYVGCEPSAGRFISCAISCDKYNAVNALSNRNMTNIVIGPTNWNECAAAMKKLEIEGW